MMTPGVGYGCAVLLVWLAVHRFRQGLRIVRYHRNLRRLPTYTLKANRIPVSRHKLFLGRSFHWTQQHTQRLRDTIRPEVQHYIRQSARYRWTRRKETEWESRLVLKWLARLLSIRAWWNPLAPLPPIGGRPQLHAVEPREQDVWMDLRERVGHTLVIGTTRVGKTRFAEILITQDIRRGDVMLVFDPKGDPELLRRVYAEAKRAGQITGNFNTLVMLRVKELATAELLTHQLPQVEIFSLMQVSASDDSSNPESAVDFTSRNEDRISVSEVPLLTPADIVTLPKRQAFALIEGGQLWKLRMPLPDAGRDPTMPESLQAMAAEMARDYSTSDHWWREEPLMRALWSVKVDSGELGSPHTSKSV